MVGYGKAEKRQVMDMTRRLLHLAAVPKPDDAADAVAIALCHACPTPPGWSRDDRKENRPMFYYLKGTAAHLGPQPGRD